MTHKVQLVSLTQPMVPGVKTAEELIVYTARVSNPSNQLNMESAPKLIKYLLDNKHFSPFEQADMGVEITTSRGISPQILRHFSFSFQEFSQRYQQVSGWVKYPARRQDTKNRQNSIPDLNWETEEWFSKAQHEVADLAFELYHHALSLGIAKEQARFLLPLSTETKLYMKGNIRDWIFYLKLRSENGTQKEHAEIAQAIIRDCFVPHFPMISEVMGW